MIHQLAWGVLIIVASATIATSYFNHQESVAWRAQINALMEDPVARPDPWTGTMDKERTLMMCTAISLLAPDRKDVVSALPAICRDETNVR